MLTIFDEPNLKDLFGYWKDEKIAIIRKMIESVDESEGLNKVIFNVFLAKLDRDAMRKVGVVVD